MQCGFDSSCGEILITLDADGQDDPKSISLLLDKLHEGYDVVFGWRHNREDSMWKKFCSGFANSIRKITTQDRIHDVGCPLRVFKREVIEYVRLSRGLHRFFFFSIAIKFGYRVGEVKTKHCPRLYGVSKYGTCDRILEGLLDLLRLCFLDIKKIMDHKGKFEIKEIIKL